MSSNQAVASNHPPSPQDGASQQSRPTSTGKQRSRPGHSSSKGRDSTDGTGRLKADQGSNDDESEERHRSHGNNDSSSQAGTVKPSRRLREGDPEYLHESEALPGKDDAGGKPRASKESSKRSARSPVENSVEDDVQGKKLDSLPACDPSVCAWLTEMGLQQYIGLFASHHVSSDLLSELNMEALETIGVNSWGHRCLMLRSLSSRRKAAEEMPSIEEDSAARPGAGKQKPNAKERSGGFGLALTVAGAQADGGNAHDNLKDVYEQMENMKMHFEAQMEQLNRELMAAKNELTSMKGVLNTSNAQPAGNGNVQQKGGRNPNGEGETSSHRRGNNPGKTNKGPRKEHVDNMMSGV
mmetsp:Transcript_19935/g.66392  ORF Transcript_19935/g.66392 Transcript_19935/m.66392 type:complete len:354 (-) Transcript_19935:1813-2874(-)